MRLGRGRCHPLCEPLHGSNRSRLGPGEDEYRVRSDSRSASPAQPRRSSGSSPRWADSLREAVVSLPECVVDGVGLRLRPRRPGSPEHRPSSRSPSGSPPRGIGPRASGRTRERGPGRIVTARDVCRPGPHFESETPTPASPGTSSSTLGDRMRGLPEMLENARNRPSRELCTFRARSGSILRPRKTRNAGPGPRSPPGRRPGAQARTAAIGSPSGTTVNGRPSRSRSWSSGSIPRQR
jgi:hypothetical protein